MTRYDRYQALKTCVMRLNWHLLGDYPSGRSEARSAAVMAAWDRVARLIFPMAGDYPRPLVSGTATTP